MNTTRRLAVLLALSILGAKGADGQEERPKRGKIDRVEDEGRERERDRPGIVVVDDPCCDGGGFWFFHFIGSTIKGIRSQPGRGYTDYPYSDRRAIESFLLEDVRVNRGFGSLTSLYYSDQGSTTQAAHLAWDGAVGELLANVEWATHWEDTQDGRDWLHTLRLGVGGLPRLGNSGFARIGVGTRLVFLDNGDAAAGPEFELGAQLFPRRPWSVSGTSRAGGVYWGYGDASVFYEGNASLGLLLGRAEVKGGYRWMKIGGTPWFSGPTLGLRLWF